VVTLSPEFFGRLFRGDRYRFEFGVRRGDDRWFVPTPDSPVLAERRRWLAQTEVPVCFWPAEGAPELEDSLALFPEEWRRSLPSGGENRLRALAAAWEPDFVLLRRDAEDEFRMAAGSVCFPSSWAPEEKLGQTVEAIHGPVPTLNADLGPRIRTFLAKLPSGSVFERENWGLSVVPERNLHPRRRLPRLEPAAAVDQVWLRVEHQAFRALPRSGGLLFVIHLTVHPLTEVLADPGVREAFRQMLETMPDAIAEYKGIQPARAALLRGLAG
jgi:hypothetical protein